jgi:hypothetical protein
MSKCGFKIGGSEYSEHTAGLCAQIRLRADSLESTPVPDGGGVEEPGRKVRGAPESDAERRDRCRAEQTRSTRNKRAQLSVKEREQVKFEQRMKKREVRAQLTVEQRSELNLERRMHRTYKTKQLSAEEREAVNLERRVKRAQLSAEEKHQALFLSHTHRFLSRCHTPFFLYLTEIFVSEIFCLFFSHSHPFFPYATPHPSYISPTYLLQKVNTERRVKRREAKEHAEIARRVASVLTSIGVGTPSDRPVISHSERDATPSDRAVISHPERDGAPSDRAVISHPERDGAPSDRGVISHPQRDGTAASKAVPLEGTARG